MSTCILTANLGNFDTPVDPPVQTAKYTFHRFTDEDFPPITGLTPRMQYRIPKTHGWQMKPGHDTYLWLDGTFTLGLSNSLAYFQSQLEGRDMVLFKHPWRSTMLEETQHIDSHLKAEKPYITSRYKHGLHMEQYKACLTDPDFVDDRLFTSTVFMYRNTPKVQAMLQDWWYHGSRYFTCDQIVLPYLIWKHNINVKVIEADQYNMPHLQIVSTHK